MHHDRTAALHSHLEQLERAWRLAVLTAHWSEARRLADRMALACALLERA